MAFGNRVSTTTQDKIMAKVVDTVLNSNVLATRFLSAAKSWGGEQLKFPVKISKNTQGGSFSGFDSFTTTAVNNRVNLTYDVKFVEKPVTLAMTELSVNATPERVLNLMKIEMASAAHDMADDIGTMFYSDGTGNSSKDIQGLELLVDDGTNSATIGGQTRATYTPYLSSTVTASGGTLTLALLRTLHSAVSSGGAQTPSAHYTTETVADLYEQLLEPQARIDRSVSMVKGESAGGAGFTAMYWKGKPVLADEKCTSGVWYSVNEKYLDWYALPMEGTEKIKFRAEIEGNDYSSVEGLGFSWSGWIMPTNQAARVGHVYLGGEFVTDNPKRQGKLTGITGV